VLNGNCGSPLARRRPTISAVTLRPYEVHLIHLNIEQLPTRYMPAFQSCVPHVAERHRFEGAVSASQVMIDFIWRVCDLLHASRSAEAVGCVCVTIAGMLPCPEASLPSRGKPMVNGDVLASVQFIAEVLALDRCSDSADRAGDWTVSLKLAPWDPQT
jgi:hypothetical protein